MTMLTEVRMTKYEVRWIEIVNSYFVPLKSYFLKGMAYPTRLVLLHS
jgi:hypothetical protein